MAVIRAGAVIPAHRLAISFRITSYRVQLFHAARGSVYTHNVHTAAVGKAALLDQGIEKMSRKEIEWPALNCLLFVSDPESEDTPAIDGKAAIWTTPECIAVSCLPDCDGPTKIILGAENDVGTHNKLLFDGTVLTPTRKLSVGTVLAEKLLEIDVPTTDTHLKIWTNGHPGSDIVIIGIV